MPLLLLSPFLLLLSPPSPLSLGLEHGERKKEESTPMMKVDGEIKKEMEIVAPAARTTFHFAFPACLFFERRGVGEANFDGT